MKKCLIIILLAFFNLNCFCQNWEWTVSEPVGSNQTSTNVLITDIYDNTYIGGRGDTGIFLIKYDPNGYKLWEKRYTGGNGYFTSLCSDNSGNIYTSMYSYSIEGAEYMPDNLSLFAKYDPNGNLIWCKQPGLGMALAERTDAQNNIIVTGGVVGTVNLENGYTLDATNGQSKRYIAKFNTNGECIWAIQDDGGAYNPIVNQRGEMFTKAELYNLTSVGQGSQQVMLDPTNGFSYCAKYDSIGTLIWAKQIHTEDYTGDNYGNTYTFEPDISDLVNGSNKNIYLIKYDSNGNQLWKRTHIYLDNGYRFAIKANNKGDLYVTGGFTNYMTIGDTTIYDGGNTRIFVAKIDSNGTLKWITTTSGAGGAGAKDITISNSNEIFITGDIGGGESVFGSHSTSQANGVFTAKLIDTEITGILTIRNSQIAFKIFPNPSPGLFQISFNSSGINNAVINIIDAKGQTIYHKVFQQIQPNFIKTIDLSKEAKGIYFIEVIVDDKKSVEKIVLD